MKKQSPSISDYHAHHGLTRDPFPVDGVDGLFYTTPELNHRLELIKHLLEFSEQLLIVNAAEGAGKTSLCHQLMEVAESSWSVNLIKSDNELSIEQLVERILEGEAQQAKEEPSSIDRLNHFLEHCLRQEKKPVLLVDDAQQLSIETLRFVIQLASMPDATQRWRVVLFSEDSLHDKLEDTEIKTLNTGLFHFIDLLPLTLGQTEAYIAYRLAKSGAPDTNKFDEQEIKQIHKISAGLPGKISHLARQSLINPAANKGSSNTGVLFSTLSKRNTISVVVIIVAVVFAWAYTGNRDHANDVSRDKLSLPPETTTLVDSQAAKALSELEVPKVEQTQQATEKVVEQPGPEPVVTKPEPTEDIVAPLPRIEPPQKEIPPPVEEIAKPASVAPAALSEINNSGWFAQQQPTTYVLQLIGAVEVETIISFVQAKHVRADKLAWFKTLQAGKDWYVLVYGQYTSRDIARADIQSLPAELKKLHPWPRSVADIQSAIQ